LLALNKFGMYCQKNVRGWKYLHNLVFEYIFQVQIWSIFEHICILDAYIIVFEIGELPIMCVLFLVPKYIIYYYVFC